MNARLTIPCLLVVSLFAGRAHALDVIGNINVDTIWRTTDSPVRLTGDVTVAAHATLTIEPGVVVEAASTDALGAGTDTGRVELIIHGAIVANGTAAERITIRGASASRASWYGIVFELDAHASSLAYVDVSDAEMCLWARTSSTLALSDLTLDNGEYGVLWQSAPGPVAVRVAVTDMATAGISVEDDGASGAVASFEAIDVRYCGGPGLWLTPRIEATVVRSLLLQNQVGLRAEAGSSVSFVNNVVAANRTIGLDLEQSGANDLRIINNTLDLNVDRPLVAGSAGTGIRVRAVTSAPDFIIRNNIVTNHGTSGITVDGATVPSVDHNNVWNNGANYVGLTAGVGSISSNPLYLEPFVGEDWTFVAWPITVSWPGHSYSNSWTATEPGAIGMRAVVTSLSTESCCDHLYIRDDAGTTYGTYSGTFAGSTEAVPDDTMVVVFQTDGSVSSAGFTISGYEYQTGGLNYRLDAASPAIDVGNDLDAPDVDRDGTDRPYDGDLDGSPDVDLGAYEWHENFPPVAVAGADVIVLPGTLVELDALASFDPDGTIERYQWDFGDGSPGDEGRAVSHTYAALGVYTVELTVTDDQDATGTDSLVVTVADNLPPTAAAGPDQFVDVAETVTFDGGASTDADGSIVSYAWDFGDGTPAGSGRNVTHAFAVRGVYTVTLTVTDNRGATDRDTASIVVGADDPNDPPVADAGGPYGAMLGEAVELDGTGSRDPDGAIVSYEWDLGDGETADTATVTHTYAAPGSYVVVLTVTDTDGATAADVASVTITSPDNDPPVADAGGPYSATLGDAIELDGSGSSDPDGAIVGYEWDLGDGETADTATFSHTYAAAGSYVVILTVTDSDGATDMDVTSAIVSTTDNDPPVADAGGDRTGLIGEELTFDASGSSDADGEIASYRWDFGDGAIVTDEVATHAFAEAGSYLVRLTVTDDDGAIGQDVALTVITDEVEPANEPPVAVAPQQQTIELGLAVLLDGSGSSDPDGTIVSYAWDLGDGTTESGESVSHTYAATGAFLVTLTVTDDQGATDQAVTLVNVVEPAEDDGGGDDAQGCRCSAAPPLDGAASTPLSIILALLGLAIVRRR